MEFELTVAIAHHGHDLESGEKMSHGFAITHPEVGAIVEQNTETGIMSVTFWYEAEDFEEGAARGARIFTESAQASGLTPSGLNAQVSVVQPDHGRAETRELQPA